VDYSSALRAAKAREEAMDREDFGNDYAPESELDSVDGLNPAFVSPLNSRISATLLYKSRTAG
jgi:hypothetical protein